MIQPWWNHNEPLTQKLTMNNAGAGGTNQSLNSDGRTDSCLFNFFHNV